MKTLAIIVGSAISLATIYAMSQVDSGACCTGDTICCPTDCCPPGPCCSLGGNK